MPEFVALLRGINVGGKKKVEMARLRQAFETAGYANVSTLLNTGNVRFETEQADEPTLTRQIETLLEGTFGFPIPTLLRSMDELRALIESDPFHGIEVTPDTRLYVTFVSELLPGPGLALGPSPDGRFEVLRADERQVCSVLTLTPDNRTVDVMGVIDKAYGRNITTRNWNTILKLGKTL